MMVGTRCRISFLQYLPKKSTKFGIKVWINAKAKTGYVLNFQVYTGSETKAKEKGLSHHVVMELMELYFFKKHCLFVDNFYTSVELLRDLMDKDTYCVGTARSNRKYFPIDLIPENSTSIGSFRFAIGTRCEATTTATMEENESAAVSSTVVSVTASLEPVSNPPGVESNVEGSANQDGSQGNVQGHDKCDDKIIALWWRDRRDVLALTTMHNTSASMIMKRPKGSRDKQPLPWP